MIDLADLLQRLCDLRPDRRPGSPGNQEAVAIVAGLLSGLGWEVRVPEFPVVCWDGAAGSLELAGRCWTISPSPYSRGWRGSGPVHPVRSEADLAADHLGAVLLLHGDLAATPLTPKAYPFYGNERDARIVDALERSGARAVLAITGHAPELAGAVQPFPLIEDGAFQLPTGNLQPAEGDELLRVGAAAPGEPAALDLPSRRWETTARNVLARRGPAGGRITVVAHLDSKPGTPGAVDNASGVVVLVRVAELLADSPAGCGVELLAVNGEDHYAAPGELHYLASTDLAEVRLAINVDGAGYRGGPTAVSTYGAADQLDLAPLTRRGLVVGPAWPQSDHMVFAMHGCPALALTSWDVATLMDQVTHSARDTPDLVDVNLLEAAAQGIVALISG